MDHRRRIPINGGQSRGDLLLVGAGDTADDPCHAAVRTVRRTDIPIIASVLEETDGSVCYAYDIAVESDCPNYNADLGFVLRRDDVLPAGYGQGATQIWN